MSNAAKAGSSPSLSKMPAKLNVLLVGGGGREHALAWKLRQSPRLGKLYLTDNRNPGLAALGEYVDVPVEWERPWRIQNFCDKNDVGFVVIGPEEPLSLGATDALATPKRPVFGPTREAAQLESNKSWCKNLLRGAAVAQAEGRAFRDPEQAKEYLRSRETPQVVKASGLAAGKGVVVAASLDEALDAVDRMMVRREFGDAGLEIVIEERLQGREASVLALVDGRNIYVLEPCQDHKRLSDGDQGPNTGGMGVFCPGGITDDRMLARIEREILVPTVDALRRDGIEYRGLLYAGVMLTPAGPKVLEYNARFGDPECQALMARFDSDLLEVLYATATKGLADVHIRWSPKASCCVVLASHGYPVKPKANAPIEGLDEAAAVEGVHVFHAGTKLDEHRRVVTGGGRVINVVGTGESVEQARERAYRAAELVRFEGKIYRKDIALTASAPTPRGTTSRVGG